MKAEVSISKLRKIYSRIEQRMSSPQIIILSFLTMIFLGTVLLYLPVSHNPDAQVSMIDALFTVTSAVCVTGLTTLETAATWSVFGKIIILCLIQIGGLSLITIFAYFLIHSGRKVTLRERLTIQTMLNANSLSGMVKMVKLIIRGTLICESLGAVILSVIFMNHGMRWNKAVFYGIFHSISAFCNAGFDLIGGASLTPYVSDFSLNITVIILIILGGLGFFVWHNIFLRIYYRITPGLKRKIRLSLHSRLALVTTGILLLGGVLYFFVFENQNPATLGLLSTPEKILASLFQSVSLRTAGFAVIPQSGLYDHSKLVSMVFMLIGGSPGGTAGGIKTVTVAIILCSVWSTLKNRSKITVFERNLSWDTLQKALAIATVMFILWCTGTLLLSFTEENSIFSHSVMDLLFEVASALGTVGNSTGITPFLSLPGKIIIMFCMFIGRIGPITLIVSLLSRSAQVNDRIQYPDEDVMIG